MHRDTANLATRIFGMLHALPAGAQSRKEIPTMRRSIALLLPLALLLGGCLDRELPSAPGRDSESPLRLLVPVPNTFTQVNASVYHSCALRNDGAVECWGASNHGQAPATRSAAMGAFTAVSAGLYHTCALRSDGVAECWGDDSFDAAPATRQAEEGAFTAVSASKGGYTCALRDDGVVECWGPNSGSGQAPPLRSATEGKFTAVSTGWYHSCALRDDGIAECWGWNDEDQAPAIRPPTTGKFTAITEGGFIHTCALRDDGIAECWGDSSNGQAPTIRPAATAKFIAIGAGLFHTCALRSDGVVECWGWNGQQQAPLARSAAVGRFAALGVGDLHTCAVRDDGIAECWGDNFYQQAPPTRSATGSTTVTVLPVATFTHPATVVAGNSFTLSLTGAHVPGHPQATAFAFAFDCGDGYGNFAADHTASCSTGAAGTRTVGGKVRDEDGHVSEYTGEITITQPQGGYVFSGFFAPVSNPDTRNVARAGQTIPLKWRLLDGSGTPVTTLSSATVAVTSLDCSAGSTTDSVEEYTSGKSGLQNLGDGYYQFNWATPKSYANSCKTMTLTLGDEIGLTRAALFQFTR